MGNITTKDGTQIFYKDWGKGQPFVFSHGWPLTADDWDAQMLFFGQNGYRVIAHDRRGLRRGPLRHAHRRPLGGEGRGVHLSARARARAHRRGQGIAC